MLKLPDLHGRHMLVTGGTNGLGLESAVQLARAGASVWIVGRNPARTEAAVATIRARAGSVDANSFLCDFGSFESIRSFAVEVRSQLPRLDVLLNNAGGVSDTRVLTVDGIEQTFAVNHLAYFLTTALLFDLVKAAPAGRIVNVASAGHYRGTLDLDDPGYANGGYSIMGAYCRSKLANVLFTRTLAARTAGTAVTTNTLHPGGVATNIWSRAPSWSQPLLNVAKWFMLTPEQGGETLSFLAASPDVQGKSGGYYHKNRITEPSTLARDAALGDQLWGLSERLVGQTFSVAG